MSAAEGTILVGVGVLVVREDGCVIVGRRKNAHGAGMLALPGGKVDYGETFVETGVRELEEETGLVAVWEGGPRGETNDVPAMELARPPEVATVLNTVMESESLQAIVPIVVMYARGDPQPRLIEPHKCEGWTWLPYADIASQPDVFPPLADFIATEFEPSHPLAPAPDV